MKAIPSEAPMNQAKYQNSARDEKTSLISALLHPSTGTEQTKRVSY